MAYKTDKLSKRIAEKFGTQSAFAKAIGMDKTLLNKILRQGKEWKGSSLIKAVRVLEIPFEEIDSYFFEEK